MTRKTQRNTSSVQAFLASVANEKRCRDALQLTELMMTVTGDAASMWGTSIIGFGTHDCTYPNGKDAQMCKVGFAPRAQSLVLYLGNFPTRAQMRKRLGKHRLSKGGCLYVNKLEDVDVAVLGEIIACAYDI